MSAPAHLEKSDWLNLGHTDHVQVLHGGHAADLAVAYRDHVTGWTERVCPLPVATIILDALTSRETEAFLGQSGYHGRRRILTNVDCIPALFCDLDYGDKPRWRRSTIHDVYAEIRRKLPTLPEPTLLASSSAHGGYAVWVLSEPLPADRLPDWQPVQDALCRLLKPYGADGRARDATRVLRVPGSRHPSGDEVRYWQVGSAYPFSAMEKAIKALSPDSKPEAAPGEKKPKKASVGRILNPYTLAHGRMNDLRRIAQSRAPMTDYRKRMMFVFSVCAAWFCPTVDVLTREVDGFTNDYFHDAHRYPAKLIGTTRRRYEDSKAGLKIPWNSPRGLVEVDPRYRMRTETIIDWLQLDDSEMENNKIIIPLHIKRERHAIAEEQRRRNRGEKERAAYLADAQRRRQMALDLSEQGFSAREVAEQLSCSKRRINQILKDKES